VTQARCSSTSTSTTDTAVRDWIGQRWNGVAPEFDDVVVAVPVAAPWMSPPQTRSILNCGSWLGASSAVPTGSTGRGSSRAIEKRDNRIAIMI